MARHKTGSSPTHRGRKTTREENAESLGIRRCLDRLRPRNRNLVAARHAGRSRAHPGLGVAGEGFFHENRHRVRGRHRSRSCPGSAVGRVRIHLIAAEGGEAWTLTAVKEGVQSFAWAPDGKRIGFTRSEPEPEAAKQRKERYGEFAIEDQEFQQSHLWGGEVPGAGEAARPESQPQRLTEGNFHVAGFAWSPDGARIAIERRSDPLINSSVTADIWLVDVATKQLTPLVQQPGPDGSPVWSPDGRFLVYSSSGGDTASHFYKNGQLMKQPVAGGAPQRLAAAFDEDLGQTVWNASGLYVVAWQKTKRQVFRIDPASGAVTPFAAAPDLIGGLDFSADGKILAFTGQTPATLGEVYRAVGSGRPVAVTNLSEQIARWTLGTSEVVWWKSQDGATIEGVLHKPKDFDPRHRYPLLVLIHGGPTGIDYPQAVYGSVYPVHQWLAKGALVLRPNYRGSAGYGEAFRSLNVRNLGVGDAWDVLSGVDFLVKQGMVDTTRMGAMGWSQGGYISAFLTTTTTRFKAISVGAGISDWMTYYVNTDIHPFTRQYFFATQWAAPEIYAKTSPMTYIKQARTPTQIQHGEFDRRVPIPNAYQLLQGLQDRGGPARLIVYRGFGHGINKPKERLAAVWHNWQWFVKYLWGEEVQLPLGATGDVKVSESKDPRPQH